MAIGNSFLLHIDIYIQFFKWLSFVYLPGLAIVAIPVVVHPLVSSAAVTAGALLQEAGEAGW